MLSTTTITGRLATAPQLRSTPAGKRVTTLRVAVSDHRLGEQPRYVDIDQWDDAAHHAVEHLVLGQEIAAEGPLDARPYTTQDGELRVGWTLLRPRVEWGSKPLRETPTERLIDEAARRREALQNAPSTGPVGDTRTGRFLRSELVSLRNYHYRAEVLGGRGVAVDRVHELP